MRRSGFTLIELLTCAAIVATLAAIFLPAVKAAQHSAQFTQCSASMRAVGAAFANYAAIHDRMMPPFTFPQPARGDIVEAGHFGGYSSYNDPIFDSRRKPTAEALGLFAMAQEGLLDWGALRCPSASIPEGTSYFPYSTRFSTYCMRIPYSRDLFETAPELIYRNSTLLNVYHMKAGSDRIIFTKGDVTRIVPQARLDLAYRLSPDVACGDGDFDPSCDALAADMFWRQDYSTPAPNASGLTYPVQWQWCHKDQFNVLYGDGSVRRREAGSTIKANTNAPGRTLPFDNANFARYAERVWQNFDGKLP